jgi:DNA-binding transcriptional regulator YdaS (Cro superfamily)
MTGLEKAIEVAGGIRALGRMLGISHSAIRQWEGEIPAKRIIDIETLTGIPREELRPDLYRREELRPDLYKRA